jgi:hypothetical protein
MVAILLFNFVISKKCAYSQETTIWQAINAHVIISEFANDVPLCGYFGLFESALKEIVDLVCLKSVSLTNGPPLD